MRPLSLDEISQVLQRKKRPVQFYEYKDLPDDAGELALLLLTHPARFLFHESAENSDIGHWTALVRRDNHICWFSSYGFLPDGELMVSANLRKAPGQKINKISRALKYLQQHGYVIHYCSVPLQRLGDGTSSCGIWCLYFLTSRIPDFEALEQKLANISVPEAYAERIYKAEFGMSE